MVALKDDRTLAVKGALIPRLGCRTWELRGEVCARIVAEAIRLGFRHVDTAQGYGNETAVGEGLRSSGEVDKRPIEQPENYSDVVRMLKRLVAASSEALKKLEKWNRTYKSGRPPRSRNFDGLVARASSQLRDDSQISEAWSAERPQAI